MIPQRNRRPVRRATWAALALAAVLTFAALGWWAETSWPAADLIEAAAADPYSRAAALLVYAFVIALPFAPGAELGLMLLIYFGAGMAVPVYAATVGGLTLAYSLGRLAPERALAALQRRLGAGEVRSGPADQWGAIAQRAGWSWLGTALHHRAVVLAVLLNTPGNSLIGGGGGIALAVGTGRLLSYPAFVATVAAAVAPIPLAVALFGRVPYITQMP
jgi:hypothetical protein